MMLAFLLLFVIVLVFLLDLGVGIAFLLHWLLPGVGLEMALLVAVIVVGQSTLIFSRLIAALPPIEEDGDVPRPRSLSSIKKLPYHAIDGSAREGDL